MKLLFDLYSVQPTGTTEFHGGGEYGKRLFMSCLEKAGPLNNISVCYDVNKYLDEWIINSINEYRVKVVDVKTHQDIIAIVNSGEYNRVYSPVPYYLNKMNIHSDSQIYGTVHGLRPAELPKDITEIAASNTAMERVRALARQMVPRRVLASKAIHSLRDSIDSMSHIFTDSLHTAASIKTLLGYDKSIEVLYPPPAKDCQSEDEAPKLKLPFERFVLMISCDRWLKNPVRGIIALDSLFSDGLLKGYGAVCVGAEKRLSIKLNNSERFYFLPYVSFGELQELYRLCDLFFYPTLNEGFGYPPVEAMKYGKTCVASAVCSVPEICGEGALYCNPYDLGEMKTRLVQASENHIDEQVVLAKYDQIRSRQEKDLELLVQRILED